MGLTNIQFSGVGDGQCEFSANIRLRFEQKATQFDFHRTRDAASRALEKCPGEV